MAAGSAFASGFTVRKDRPKDGHKFQYFILLQEMEKRGISIAQMALALKETANVVKGAKGDFPLEKVDLLLELVNNWTGPIVASKRISKPAELRVVTREMLLI